MERTVTIPLTRYEALLKAERFLECLEAAGVDNWEWFGEAKERFQEEDNDSD